MQLQFSLSSRRSSSLAAPVAFPRHITRLVISYQAPRHIEKNLKIQELVINLLCQPPPDISKSMPNSTRVADIMKSFQDPDAKGAAKPAVPTVTGGLRTHPTKSRPCSSNSTKNQFFSH
ncbi:unnamed protein product [Pieris brassicae]|uniref:Uncharacterized protein n=1 Tax=Pieris brassicae TaxID=7116 RepID=A0A9P0SV64_PIEBR|nr:unnamed protein product [Pieris brassicae]